jgi:hypothetical protein
MDLINSNPYRTLGLLVGTKASEQSRQIKRLKQFIEAEQEPDANFSFPVLGNFSRTLESVVDAEQKINLDSDKINAALFWFYNGNAITDEPAFDFLTDGNIDEAKSIWLKLTNASDINERNASAFHNLSTLFLCNDFSNNKSELQKGIILKLQFLESEFVINFVKIATDETYKTTSTKLQILFLNQLQTEIEKSKVFSIVDFFNILNNLNFSAKEDFFKIFVQKPIHEIDRIITETKTKRNQDKTKSIEYGNILYNSTEEYLEQLKSVIGKTNIKLVSISDKVADEILQCGIENFNFYKDSDENKAKETLDLFQKVEKLAIGNITIERYLENYVILKNWIDSSLERNDLIRLQKYCWYCDKNIGEDKFKYETDIYKVISRGGVIQKEVNYKKSKIKVNRCGDCKKIHSKGWEVFITVFLVAFCISFYKFYILLIKNNKEIVMPFIGCVFCSLLVSGIILWIVSSIGQGIICRRNNIKTEGNIQELIFKIYGSGWSTSKPSAK